MREVALVILAVMISSLGALADAPYPRVPVSVILAGDEAAGLKAFREKLRLAVSRRDRAAVLSHVSPDFSCFRDFGGLCEGAIGRASFELIFVFDDSKLSPDYAGWGWRRLAAMLRRERWAPCRKARCSATNMKSWAICASRRSRCSRIRRRQRR